MDGQVTRYYSGLFAKVVAVLIVLTALLALGGWMFGIPQLTTVLPGYATMKPVTALCFLLCGISLWLQDGAGMAPTAAVIIKQKLATVLALIAALIGLLSICQYLFVQDFGIDLLLFRDKMRGEGQPYPGRMSLATGLNFLLIGTSLVILGRRFSWARYAPDILMLLVMFISLIAINGYLYDAPSLYRIVPFSSISFNTALLSLLLGIGTLAVRPDRGIALAVNSGDSGGLAARLLLPVAIVAPMVIGWLLWQGELAGWYDAAFGLATYTTALISMLTGLILFAAYRLNSFSASRRRAFQLVEIQRHALEQVALGAKLSDTLNEIIRDVEKLEPEMMTSILFLSEDGTRVRHGASLRLPGEYLSAIDGLSIGPSTGSCGTAAWRGEQVVVSDIQTDPLWADYRELASRYGLRACWSTPIFGTSGKVLATFAIYYQTPRFPDARQQRLITTVTQIVAVAIERARAIERLVKAKADMEAAQERGNIGSWELVFGAPQASWSRQMYRIFRRDPNQPVPAFAQFLRLIHRADRKPIINTLTRNGSLRGRQHLEFRLLPSLCGVRYVSATIDPILDEQGNTVAVAGTALDITDRKIAEITIRQSLSRQQELSRRLAEVEEDERRKISRELHDRIGSELSAINLNLDIIRSVLPADTSMVIGQRLTDTQLLVRNTIEHTHDILAELRPPGLDDYGLIVALETYAGLVEQRLGIPVLVGGCRSEPPLSLLTKTAIYRIVNEALNNVAKHAAAGMVNIDLMLTDNLFRLTVMDDGVGFDPPGTGVRGYGLLTMQERAEAVAAKVTVKPGPESGTRVIIDVECSP